MLSPVDTSVRYGFTSEETAADSKQLAATSATEFSYDKNGFRATVTREKDTLVFFSVPFDEGWSATVNGKKVDIEKVNIGFMAVPVTSGESDIVFTYKTPLLYEGMMVSGGAAAVFLIYLLICLITRKKRAETVYPEGDELIEKWLSWDIADALSGEAVEENTEPSLDDIAEKLNHEYPVLTRNNEFIGGFSINTGEDEDTNK